MALKLCRECGKEVSDQAETCPHCGIKNPTDTRQAVPSSASVAISPPAQNKASGSNMVLIIAGVAAGLLVLFVWVAGSGTPSTTSPESTQSQAVQELPEVLNAISVDDFMVDATKYADQTVSIRGNRMCLNGTVCYLYSDGNDTLRGVIFDPSKLSRDDRKMLLDCNIYANKCSAVLTAQGVSNEALGQIVPNRIDWLQQPTPPSSQ